MLVNKYYNAIVSARLMEIATAAASVVAAIYADAIALGPTAIPAFSMVLLLSKAFLCKYMLREWYCNKWAVNWTLCDSYSIVWLKMNFTIREYLFKYASFFNG